MIYIGIDPGKKGAIALLSGGTIHVSTFDRKRYASTLKSAAESDEGALCCLEHVGARPGQGVTSMFSFGENFGFIQGLLTAYSIPFELVRPQKWKKEFSITSNKNKSIAVCKRLFPDVSLLPTARCTKDNDGIAEALLLALYAKRRLDGQKN